MPVATKTRGVAGHQILGVQDAVHVVPGVQAFRRSASSRGCSLTLLALVSPTALPVVVDQIYGRERLVG
jgi:hypothetical protein